MARPKGPNAKPRTAKVYVVSTPGGRKLVRAFSARDAVAHVVAGTHVGALATQDDLLALAKTVEVEDATTEK